MPSDAPLPVGNNADASGEVRQAPRSGRSSYLVVFLGLGMQNLVLLGLNILLASYFGTSAQFDAYNSNALAVPLMFSALIAGTLGPVLITVLGRQHPHKEVAPLTGLVVGVALLVSLLLAVTGMLFDEPIMRALHRGQQPEFITQASRYFRILVWLIPLNTLIGLFQSILNASLHFVLPAVAGVLGPLVTVWIMLVMGPAHGVEALAWATIAGGVVNVLLQLPLVLRRMTLQGAWGMRWKLRSLSGLAVPILLGTLLQKFDPVVDRDVCSSLDAGTISRLRYAGNLMTVFVVLASGTLSTVSFPRIARNLTASRDSFIAEVRQGLSVLILLCLPAVVVMTFFPETIIRDLLQRGSFTPEDTAAVAVLLRISAVLFVAASVSELCTKIFYVLGDSITPNLILVTVLLAGFAGKFWLVPARGVETLVSITSMVYAVLAASQLSILWRRLGNEIFHSLWGQFLRCVMAATAAAAAGWGLLQSALPLSGLLGLAAGAVAYFAIILLLDRSTRELLLQWRRSASPEREADSAPPTS